MPQVLAHFGEAVQPPLGALRDVDTQVFGAMLARRRQLVAILVAEKNRLSRTLREVRPRIEAHIAWLEQQLCDMDGELPQTLISSPVWREKDQLLRSIPGEGNQVSMTLLADLPELGSLGGSRSQLWSRWPHSAEIADAREGSVLPRADGPECAPCCTWEPWWRHAGTPLFESYTSGFWRQGSPRNRHFPPEGGSCRPCSTAW